MIKIFFKIFLLSSLLFTSYNLPEIAEKIKNGKIKAGENYGMGIEERYHKIHNDILGIECSSCHIEKYQDDYLYQKKYKEFENGPVDRGICLGCHKENGPAKTKLYGNQGD